MTSRSEIIATILDYIADQLIEAVIYDSRIPNHIPIVFHNLSGYDAHLFIRRLGRKFNSADIGVNRGKHGKIYNLQLSTLL